MDERAIEIGHRLLSYDLADVEGIVADVDHLFQIYDAEFARSVGFEAKLAIARARITELEEQVAELQQRLGF